MVEAANIFNFFYLVLLFGRKRGNMRWLSKGYCSLATLLLIIFSFPLTLPAEQSALNYFVDGVEAYDSGNYEQAIPSIQKAIELDPLNLEFQYYLGLSYSALNRNEEAIEVFGSIVEKEPVKFKKVYFEIAALYAKEKRYQEALDTLTLVEEISPDDPRIFLEKGYVYKNLEDYDKAVESFNKAKDLDPELTQVVYYNIAVVYFETEQFDRAEQEFVKAIDVNPETAVAENARQSINNVKLAKRARKPWNLSASVGWSYDDNVLLQALEQAGVMDQITGEVQNKSDDFQTLLVTGGYKFINRKDFEAGAGYTLFCTGYYELVDNNLLGHIPYIYAQLKEPIKFQSLRDLRFYARIEYNFSYYYAGARRNDQDNGFYLTFGDNSHSEVRIHSIMPTITIVEPYDLKSEITLNWQRKEYFDKTSDARHYLGGIVQSYKLPDSERYPRVGYKYGYEHAKDSTYSYQYHEGLVGFSSPIYWGVKGDISLTHNRTYYQKNPDFSEEGERDDRQYILAISLSRTISERFQVLLSYNYTQNDSNVQKVDEHNRLYDPYEFRKNTYSVMVTRSF